MKTNKLTFVTLLSALFITVSAFAPGYAAQNNPPPLKAGKPGGACTQAQCQQVFADAGQNCNDARGTKTSSGQCNCSCYDVGGSRKIKK